MENAERFLNQFLESPLPTYLWRRVEDDFVFEETNLSGAKLGGGVYGSYAGATASEIYRERPDILEALHQAWDGRQMVRIETPYRLTAVQRDVVLQLEIAPLLPDRLVIYVHDLTAQRDAERRLIESERRYRAVIDGASDGVVIVDATGRIEEANPRAAEMFGYEPGEVAGKAIEAFLTEADRQADPIRLDREQIAEGVVRERTLLRKDGSIIPVELGVRTLGDGRTVALIRDITSRRSREETLRRREHEYRRMIDLSPDAILVHSGGTIVYANDALLRLLGAAHRDEVLGKPALFFLHPDSLPLVEARLHELLERRRDVPMVVEKFIRVDGTVIDVEVAGLSIEYEGRRSVQVIARDISERVRQEDALRRSEERYRGLVEGASEAIYRFATDGRILSVNPAGQRITGRSEHELEGMHFEALVHPDELPAAHEVFTTALSGRTATGVFRVLTSSGEYIDLETTTTPEFEDGRVVAVFGMARDISGARNAARGIEESERLLATVLDRLPVGVLIADAGGHIVRSNPVADTIWGFHPTDTAIAAQVKFQGWWADSGKALEPEDWASTRALLHGEESHDELIDILSLDGVRKTILNSAVPLRDEQGTITGAVILNQDVTERRELARQREALGARLRQVISSTADGICTIDDRGLVTLVNPAGAEMLGYEQDALLGANFHEVVHGGNEAENPYLAVMAERVARPLFSDSFRRKGGHSFTVEGSCSPIVVENVSLGAVITFRDVTRRNALERELDRARRLSSLGQLAATIAHEFNNVMMGIMPFLEVIIRRADSDDSLRSIAGHINQSLLRAKQITHGILKFARGSEPKLVAILLPELLRSAEAELRALAAVEVELRIDPAAEHLAICVDRVQFQQVLSNLVANARDALGGAGTIVIEASPCDARDLARIGHSPATDYVRVSVIDRGTGMDPRTMEMMFEPLFTTKSGGTGLGLAVVQQVMTSHRGLISVDSSAGQGTSFHLFFPITETPLAADPPAQARPPGAIRRLVLVEDDPNVAAGLSAILELSGIEVRVVTLGRDAVAEVERFVPDAVIVDRGLPDIDGIDVYYLLAARWPDLPIVFSTGHGGSDDLDEMLSKPHVGYLLKPYEIDTLLEVLERVRRKE